jgi:hypothetical protein
MVFTAHRAHPKGKKTWFGYWRNDGLTKTKHRGRVDANGTWAGIRDEWINAFRNRDVVSGRSLMCNVGPNDEWCAEAYLKTDYASIQQDHLINAAKRYMIAQVMLPETAIAEGATDGD